MILGTRKRLKKEITKVEKQIKDTKELKLFYRKSAMRQEVFNCDKLIFELERQLIMLKDILTG